MIRRILIALATISNFSAVQAQMAEGQAGADLIVVNAKIFTGMRGQTEASALAVKNGRIYSVGSDEDILGLKNSETNVIDARSP